MCVGGGGVWVGEGGGVGMCSIATLLLHMDIRLNRLLLPLMCSLLPEALSLFLSFPLTRVKKTV